jgi:hypothetical protein
MIEKKTIVDQIEVTRSGHVQVRLALLLVEDGVEISSRWHRVVVEPGGDVDAAIAAVNADITKRETLKAPPVETDKVPLLKGICKLAHSPEVVKQYKASVLAAQKEFENAKPA